MSIQRKWWAIAAAVALVAVAGGTASASTATPRPLTAQQAASPFDSTTKFCTASTAPPGRRNSSNPGVTPDSIVIGDQSIDTAPLRRLGVVSADYPKLMKVFINEINKCGGINGRKLVLKQALYNPTAIDQQGHLQALCIKLTEDYKSFIVTGVTSALMQRCLSIQHKSITDAPNGVTSTEFNQANGRIISLYPAGDDVARAALLDGVREGTFKNKEVAVVGPVITATAVAEHRDQYIDVLASKGVKASLEMLPCIGTNCTAQMSGVVSRLKSRGTDVIVLSNQWPTANVGNFLREMKNQNLKALLYGPYTASTNADSSMASVTSSAGRDGLSFIDQNGWYVVGTILSGQWRSGRVKATDSARMCQKTVAQATGDPEVQFTEQGIGSQSFYAITFACQTVRAIARAIWSLGNNVTTERMVDAMRNLKAIERADTGAYPVASMWYTKGRTSPPFVTTSKMSYPCSLPKVDVTRGCFMPLDSPLRWRAAAK